ncbi:MAG TPA: hypothetical protein DEB06_09080 [Phycisphaerales bacterium]|nr:hypothetical protein [Phycisphaerales bacterium]
MKFFFDNCLSPRLATALNALVEPEHSVVHLRDKFATPTPDTDWIVRLSEEGGWIIVSGDLRISKRPTEREVWRAAKLTTFFMADGYQNLDEWQQVRVMIEKWPQIMDLAERTGRGSAFRVPIRSRKIETL